nr:MAG TPA: hypothetical protein [Caudoviricetes sp.]
MKQALNPLRPTPRHCRNTVPGVGLFGVERFKSVSKNVLLSDAYKDERFVRFESERSVLKCLKMLKNAYILSGL